MKKSWQSIPPLPITVLAIAKCLGLEIKETDEAQKQQKGEVFYDESYYENTSLTPWKDDAAKVLSSDFQAAGGVVK